MARTLAIGAKLKPREDYQLEVGFVFGRVCRLRRVVYVRPCMHQFSGSGSSRSKLSADASRQGRIARPNLLP